MLLSQAVFAALGTHKAKAILVEAFVIVLNPKPLNP